MSSPDFALRKISEMQDKHAGDFTISPEAFWHSHVQLRWQCVRKIVKAQSSLMAVDSLGELLAIPRPQRPKHQVGPLPSRKAGQPIDSPVLTDPVSRLNVIRVRILREPRSFGLLRREEALLAFRDSVEPLRGFFASISHGTILQLI